MARRMRILRVLAVFGIVRASATARENHAKQGGISMPVWRAHLCEWAPHVTSKTRVASQLEFAGP